MVRKSKSSISTNRKIVKVLYLNGKSVKIETEVSSKVFKINENTQAIPITSSEIMIKFVSILEDYE